MTEAEKQQERDLLNEIDNIKRPDELADWCIRANAFLVFMAAKYPNIVKVESEVT